MAKKPISQNVTISDVSGANQLLVNSDGSINVNGGGGGGSNVNINQVGGTAVSNTTPGVLDVNVLSGGGSNASVSATGAAVPASATMVGVQSGANLTALTVGQTTMAVSLPVALASDQSIVATASRATASDAVSNTNILGRPQDASGNPSFLGSLPYAYNGTTWDRVRGDATNGLTVNLGTNNDVTATGNVANDAADSGNPVKVGGVYRATLASVADGDRTDAQSDTYGNLRTLIAGQQVTGTDNIANNALVSIQANSSTSTGTLRPLLIAQTVYDGTAWDMMRGDATDGTLVNLGANNDVTATGNVANDAVDSGNPLKIGGYASATAPTNVAGADRVNAWFFLNGSQAVQIVDSTGTALTYNANGSATPTNSAPVVVANPTAVATNQVAPTGSAATLLASRAFRTRVTFKNIGAVTVYIGPATVTTANGFPLLPGESISYVTTALFQAITASGTGAIAYTEEY